MSATGDSREARDRAKVDELFRLARGAAYEAFLFKDAYVDADLQPSADAAMRAVLVGLQNCGLFGPSAPLPGWECAMPVIELLLGALDKPEGN